MAYEDFQTFTLFDEDDPDSITVDSATKVSWVNFDSRDLTGYLYKDYNAGHFSGDFNHQFEIQFANVANLCIAVHWGLWNIIGDFRAVVDASEDGCAFRVKDDTENLELFLIEDGATSSDDWSQPGPQPSTTYYVTVDRDDDGGVNNTGQYVAYIRTGSHAGVLRDTLTKDAAAGEQNDYRYLYAVASVDSNAAKGPLDGYTENLDLNEAVAAAPTAALYGPLMGPMGGPI